MLIVDRVYSAHGKNRKHALKVNPQVVANALVKFGLCFAALEQKGLLCTRGTFSRNLTVKIF